MKKRVILVLILIILVLSGCTDISEETGKDIGDKTTGGVIICSVDYPCGTADDICPEDYGAECKVEDPDCNK